MLPLSLWLLNAEIISLKKFVSFPAGTKSRFFTMLQKQRKTPLQSPAHHLNHSVIKMSRHLGNSVAADKIFEPTSANYTIDSCASPFLCSLSISVDLFRCFK